MKIFIPLLVLAVLLFSCDNSSKKKSVPVKNVPLNERQIPVLPGTNASNTVIGGAHYICPKNCIGGTGAAAGQCPVCQTEMAHNQGFHVGPNANSTTSPLSSPNLLTTPTNSDGPNANGQYHYTCSKGCAGGSGKAGNCSNCGNTLAHNAAFHN